MKKRILASLALYSCLAATSILAQENCHSGFYVGAFGGGNFLPTERHDGVSCKIRPGFVVGADAGYQFNRFWRLEGEFAYRHNNINKVRDSWGSYHTRAHIDTYTLMVNGFWDINYGTCIIPYVGIGLGYAWHECGVRIAGVHAVGRTHGLAEQYIAGAKYDFDNHVRLGLEYRFMHSKGNMNDHSAVVNLSYAL